LPFALNECRNYHHLLKGTGISLIGVGGVSSGVDAYRFLLAGCDACEVGSHLEANGPDSIDLINHTLSVMLKNKGYSSIMEAKGKLKLLRNANDQRNQTKSKLNTRRSVFRYIGRCNKKHPFAHGFFRQYR
jgi:hypothetical protein